jgi:hypothetical protein
LEKWDFKYYFYRNDHNDLEFCAKLNHWKK